MAALTVAAANPPRSGKTALTAEDKKGWVAVADGDTVAVSSVDSGSLAIVASGVADVTGTLTVSPGSFPGAVEPGQASLAVTVTIGSGGEPAVLPLLESARFLRADRTTLLTWAGAEAAGIELTVVEV